MSSREGFSWRDEIKIGKSDYESNRHKVPYVTMENNKIRQAIQKYGVNTKDRYGNTIIGYIDFTSHKESVDALFDYDVDIYPDINHLLLYVSYIAPYYGEGHFWLVKGKKKDRDVSTYLLQRMIEKDTKGLLCTYICSKLSLTYELEKLVAIRSRYITLLQFFKNICDLCEKIDFRKHGIDYEQTVIACVLLENHSKKFCSFFDIMFDKLNISKSNKKQRF